MRWLTYISKNALIPEGKRVYLNAAHITEITLSYNEGIRLYMLGRDTPINFPVPQKSAKAIFREINTWLRKDETDGQSLIYDIGTKADTAIKESLKEKQP